VSTAPTIEALLGPGGQYEITTEDVLGVPLQVYKHRFRSMRDLVAIGDSRGDTDWLVQGDRRLSYGEHNAEARKVAVRCPRSGWARTAPLLTANRRVGRCSGRAGMGAARVPLNAVDGRARLRHPRRRQGAVLRPALGDRVHRRRHPASSTSSSWSSRR
jgi:hypothetical protein